MSIVIDKFIVLILIVVILYAILLIKTGNPLDISCVITMILLIGLIVYEQTREPMDNYEEEYNAMADPHYNKQKNEESITSIVDDLVNENELDPTGYNIQNLDNSDGYGDYLQFMSGSNKNIKDMYDLDSLGQLDSLETFEANEFEPLSINKQMYNDKAARDSLFRGQHDRRALEGMAQGSMDIMHDLLEEEFDYNENRDWWDLEGELYEQEYGPYI